MEVKISFDTEKESTDDLKRLVQALQDLISKREGKTQSSTNTQHIQTSQQQSVQPQQVKSSQTNGGGRVIPYEDMSGTLAKIVSGKKY